ncbi:hypothetical protein [Acinetobacter pollinis]|uniref:PIN domain-containing protein n=1 Tax=Acinetobacter pollinis TaxID=2605270 RepID=A0ABU6DP07_9GAMM|nr:hypothetical protein [Acinetobacter pollinis]MBF7689895.1 hypothetical protein [Acinetobacter pollinis]MBF7692428.1 hypothetical protein [Acinetobacter pollinis]MBF7697253.1 hypothetical protein [Acinetobacter pollinis]MBF7701130.1 hypothetical protein [Acinetobacter pollinis]MEB5475591.1 hypothetical protein [Acinetobacter pollinis]
MNLEFTHKPNYFLYAQLLIRHIEDQLNKDKTLHQIRISFEKLKHIFQEDTAATSTNLDSILHIASEYKIETLSGDERIIQKYAIDVEDKELILNIPESVIQSWIDEKKPILFPNSMDYD